MWDYPENLESQIKVIEVAAIRSSELFTLEFLAIFVPGPQPGDDQTQVTRDSVRLC